MPLTSAPTQILLLLLCDGPVLRKLLVLTTCLGSLVPRYAHHDMETKDVINSALSLRPSYRIVYNHKP